MFVLSSFVNGGRISKPVLGMLIGLIAGGAIGFVGVVYFDVGPWFDRLCVVGSCLLISQLLGATIAAALGKPHQVD